MLESFIKNKVTAVLSQAKKLNCSTWSGISDRTQFWAILISRAKARTGRAIETLSQNSTHTHNRENHKLF